MHVRELVEKIRPLVPLSIRKKLIQPVVFETAALLHDTTSRILGQHDPDAPPSRLRLLGSLNYKANGFEFLHYFLTLGKLAPDHHVLDIGCGMGGKAAALARYLRTGRYEGIDIIPQSIAWCRDKIASRHPNFHFQVADLYNPAYNPTGRQKAAEYRFPFADASFDFIYLTSVFTHLLDAETRNYMREIARLLKPGGRVLSTWFLLDPKVQGLMAKLPAVRQFRHTTDASGVFVQDPELPEAAVAYDASLVRQLHDENGLTIEGPIHGGSWCNRPEHLSYQDIVVAVRR
jgi:SAM-dependent methyltransferase